MKLGVRLVVATAFGFVVAIALNLQASAQVGGQVPPPDNVAMGTFGPFNPGGLHPATLPVNGVWAEIINVNQGWMVIQNQAGQEFPISQDKIGQFLIRWPYAIDALTNRSVIEVTGPESVSNTIIADHIDVYEGGDQNLVSQAVNSFYGANRTLTPVDIDQQSSYGVVYWMSPEEFAIPSRIHVVGPSVGAGTGSVRVAGFGQNSFTIQPSVNGMSATQVTRGNMTYAKPGDVVYIIPFGYNEKSLSVSQLVLYKKIPLNRFQP